MIYEDTGKKVLSIMYVIFSNPDESILLRLQTSWGASLKQPWNFGWHTLDFSPRRQHWVGARPLYRYD